jgi:hypothetical protein
MKSFFSLSVFFVFCYSLVAQQFVNQPQRIDLKGIWNYKLDPADAGIKGKWYNDSFSGNLTLPGSLTTNGIGDDISLDTPWTGSIFDSSYYKKEEYRAYREKGNIKVPFWLQPVKYYKGAAWYQKEVSIDKDWDTKSINLVLERCHWQTTVWIDDKQIGSKNSLGTAHNYDLSGYLRVGKHKITIRIDNRLAPVNVGENSHSVSDHTQSNWNGIAGQIYLEARPALYVKNIQFHPDINGGRVLIKGEVMNTGKSKKPVTLHFKAGVKGKDIPETVQTINTAPGTTSFTVSYPLGDNIILWDEYNPELYTIKVRVNQDKKDVSADSFTFGMREVGTKGTQITINNRIVFLRGTLECAVFPVTGYPATDEASWLKILTTIKNHGLNHVRFHSWCPPEAAFAVADRLGIYLQVECSSWANWGTEVGGGQPIDAYIYEESRNIVAAYGNHPSFCMLTYGNEPGGKNQVTYLRDFVTYWKERDDRFLYTTGSGWPFIDENDFNVNPAPRIQQWEEELKSIINSAAPSTNYDWADDIKQFKIPTVSHEIGQWCVYPNFSEMDKYKGVLQPKNYEIFLDRLKKNGLEPLKEKFLYASGKLQALCYKADIEAALRTKGFAGFQLLGLSDFPGQGTALVGVLDSFWEEKGYISPQEFKSFSGEVVPLARFPKMVFLNNETLEVPVEIAQFGANVLQGMQPVWEVTDSNGSVLFKGTFDKKDVPRGNAISLGRISQPLAMVQAAKMLTLTVSTGGYSNHWDFFVYPASQQKLKDNKLYITRQIDAKARKQLNEGGTVLLTLKKGTLRADKGGDIEIGFSSIFWNTAWTNGQAPFSLGILCNPSHKALAEFPTNEYSYYQWSDAFRYGSAIKLDEVKEGLEPIVRVIDDWFTARSLGFIFECKVGKGKLLVSGIDLLTNAAERPEARQLLYSLNKYIVSGNFNPSADVSLDKIETLYGHQ